MKDNEAENSLVVHHKAYDGESIVDLYRDISEMLDERMNPVAGKIPTDEHGF